MKPAKIIRAEGEERGMAALDRKEKEKEYTRAYYQNNKGPIKERAKAYLQANPEKAKKKRENEARWRANNRERVRELGKRWREKNPAKHKEHRERYEAKSKEKKSARQKEYYKLNKEAIRAKAARARDADPEKYKEKNARAWAKSREAWNAYRRENKEQFKENSAKWIKANPDKTKMYSRKYRINHPEACRANEHNRRARERKAPGRLSKDIIEKLLILQRGKCAACKKSLKRTGYHLDHIIPLVRGGANSDKNVQLTCPRCNLKKRGKDPIQFMQELGYLL